MPDTYLLPLAHRELDHHEGTLWSGRADYDDDPYITDGLKRTVVQGSRMANRRRQAENNHLLVVGRPWCNWFHSLPPSASCDWCLVCWAGGSHLIMLPEWKWAGSLSRYWGLPIGLSHYVEGKNVAKELCWIILLFVMLKVITSASVTKL